MARKKTVKRNLPCLLTKDEVIKKAEAAAKEVSTINLLEESKKAEATRRKEEIDDHKVVLNKLCVEIATGKEEREISCEVSKDFTKRIVELFRTDTGEFVESRPMSEAEFQPALTGMDDEGDEEGIEN